MTETRPKIADDLQFEPGQLVRIRCVGHTGTIVKVYRTPWSRGWQYVIRHYDSRGNEEESTCVADDLEVA